MPEGAPTGSGAASPGEGVGPDGAGPGLVSMVPGCFAPMPPSSFESRKNTASHLCPGGRQAGVDRAEGPARGLRPGRKAEEHVRTVVRAEG